MKTYELSNPSDKYTLQAESDQAACWVALVLGRGKYGLLEMDGTCVMPPFIFGGHDEWCQKKFGMTVEDLGESIPPETVATVLESFVIGDRETYEAAVSAITDDTKRQQFIEKWNDKRRSSMNDIGGAARKLAKAMRDYVSKQTATADV